MSEAPGPGRPTRSGSTTGARSEAKPKVVLQAHATRAATAMALLLHAGDRGPRDIRKPFGPLIAGVVVAVVILLAIFIAGRMGSLTQH